MWPNKVLMVKPSYFDVEYSINPHMKDAEGHLNTINKPRALKQWAELSKAFSKSGLQVQLLTPEKNLPDMVFCANPFFPYKDKVLLSNMASPYRAKEVEICKVWAIENNFEVLNLPVFYNFEGMGDLLLNYETDELFGGFGYRTDVRVYSQIESLLNKEIHRLELVSPHFYHLDTCLCIIDAKTALYVPEAFTQEGRKLIMQKFPHHFAIPNVEALSGFAGNSCAISRNTVLVPENCPKTTHWLLQIGKKVLNIDTGEFIKSGGSIFCMKMLYS